MIAFGLATLSGPLGVEHPRCQMSFLLLTGPLPLSLRPPCLLLPYHVQHLRPLPLYQPGLPGGALPRYLLGTRDGHGLIVTPLLAVFLLHMLGTSDSYISLNLLLLPVDLLPGLTAKPLTEALLSLLANHSCHRLLMLTLN
jgi:hypothetical protein